jgi:abortive infection alpha-like protein
MTAREPGAELSLYVEPDSSGEESLLQIAPALVRLAAGAYWRTAQWTLETSARAGARIFRAAVSGESTAHLLQSTGAELRGYARRVLGVANGSDGAPSGDAVFERRERGGATSLQELGAELLRRSADVRLDEDAHPAYARILAELAPDEARILRLFALEGPQPAVDVRTSRPLNIGSQLVAPGLTMIGAQAGCRHTDRVNAYLNNLFRLGLIWFSREPLPDPLRYQVLEAQPDVGEAMRKAGRARTIRRSIHLTPFGEDFCATCLPLE